MSLTVRHPNIDLSQGFKRHWYGGNIAVTHAFNALSWMFPQGEKFFIDAAREVAKTTDLKAHTALEKAVRDFISQELVHSHHHKLYNKALEAQGFPNVIEPTIKRLNDFSLTYLSDLTNLGIVSAYEHYTAILGDFLLKNPDILKPAQKELALVWGWHAVEETEHKAVCFDLYKVAGGGYIRRVVTFLLVSSTFLLLFLRSYLSMLYQDKALHPKRIITTIAEATPFFWGRRGLVWSIVFNGLKYLTPWFHPWNQDNAQSALRWIEANKAAFKS